MASLTSCDFLRKMAGRPTSAELSMLEIKRDSLELDRRLKLKQHNGKTQVPVTEDTLVAKPVTPEPASLSVNVEQQKSRMRQAARSILLADASRYRGCPQMQELFYVISATFNDENNAERNCERLRRDGFPQAQSLRLGNGKTLTAVFATDEAEQALSFISDHKSALPKEVWILINDQR